MKTIELAQILYRHSRGENGSSRDLWSLAQRLAGYIRHPCINKNEEIAFDIVDGDRVGISRFKRKVPLEKSFVMISIERGTLPATIWNKLFKLGTEKYVHTDPEWD